MRRRISLHIRNGKVYTQCIRHRSKNTPFILRGIKRNALVMQKYSCTRHTYASRRNSGTSRVHELAPVVGWREKIAPDMKLAPVVGIGLRSGTDPGSESYIYVMGLSHSLSEKNNCLSNMNVSQNRLLKLT